MANFWTGSPEAIERTPRFDPQRMAGFDQILQQALSGLSQGGGGFGPIEQRETQRFQQETVPGIAERFTSMGAGAQGSSGFAEALGGAGAQLGTGLGALRSQHELGRQSQLMSLLGMGLTPQEEITHFQQEPGFLGTAGSGLAQGLGYGIPIALGAMTGGTSTAAAAAVPLLIKILGMLGGGGQSGGSVSV